MVNEKLQLAGANLPPEAERPVLAPISSIMGEIMFISLTSAKQSPMELRSTADWAIRPRLLSMPGISQVTPIGGDIKEYQVLVSPQRMAGVGVTLAELLAAVNGSNQNTSPGFYIEDGQECLIHGIGRVSRIDDITNTVVKITQRQPVLVRHLADVRVGPAIKRGDGSAQGKAAVILGLQKQPGANTLTLTQALDRTRDDI